MTTIPELLAPVKTRAGAAAAGPWKSSEFGSVGAQEPERFVIHKGKFDWGAIVGGDYIAFTPQWDADTHADAAFIAQARTDVPRLVAAIEAVAGMHYESVAYADDVAEGGNDDVPEDYERSYCNEDGHDWPCPTIAAVVAALESEA